MAPSRSSTIRRASVLLTTLLAAGGAITALAPLAGAEVLSVSPSGTFVIEMRGIGHGHGMSQYGARGAALQGQTYRQILAFYYPKTALTTLTTGAIRVRLSGSGTTTTVAALPHLVVTGYTGDLPTTGFSKYRLVTDASTGITLEQLASTAGASWTTLQTGLPNGATLRRTAGRPLRLYMRDGTSTYLYGSVRAWRINASGTAGGVITVNRVGWDQYAQGVVSSEMPTSWPAAAVDAQAVAARTYGAYAVAHPMGAHYDICDTSMCQVYGGHSHVDAQGHQLWSDYPTAAVATSNQILTYAGGAIFSQFGASDGGWTVDGGQPYLVSKADPYDAAASGDPYLDYKHTFSVPAVAKAFGLAKVTSIAITKRDGNGTWNGRMLAGYVAGTDSTGHAKTVATTGFSFESALGLGTTWMRLLAS